MAVSISSYISVYHSDTSLKIHEGRVKKAANAFKELHDTEKTKLDVVSILAGQLLKDDKFFAFINHDYDAIGEEFEAAFEFAKLLAYAYEGWALVVFSSEVEGHKGSWLISKDYGIIELKENEKFAKEMEYLFTKAEFLRAKRKLEELEKERDGRE
ncbi:hypothetical protein [Thermococcus sp. 21S7]|uniref:hypothetical protein n=1 Tax=Thermococcus sp. 21S7 TaxID=1638221 RepID=UPI001438C498|nr:hypothetical protein [Thermococcus sp. 21S7]NJE60448.1 hypothetical protein [Thermococcus sp. 21S7]